MISKVFYSHVSRQSVLIILSLVSFSFWPSNINAQKNKICSDVNIQNQTPQQRSYNLGDQLMTTELFDLYGRLAYASECWCNYSSVKVVVVFKRDENYKIEDNEEYKNQVENVIVPFVRSKCGDFSSLEITHHVKDHYLDISGNVQNAGNVPRQSFDMAYLNINSYNDEGTLKRKFSSKGSINGVRQNLMDLKIANEKRKAEIARTAEEARKTSIERRKPIHRKLAADVLKIMNLRSAKNPPASYDFSGYENKYYWENIYIGNFKPFTDKYDEAEDYAKATAKAMADGNAADLYNLANLRPGIMAANFAYHRAYEDTCQTNKEIPWVKIPLTIPARAIRDGFANIIGRTQEMTEDYFIREPFVERVSADFGYMTDPKRAVSDYTYKRYKDELTKFITAEKCSSPSLRQFEVNLYLAERWFLPLQELYQPEQIQDETLRPGNSTDKQPKKSESNNSTSKPTAKPNRKPVRRKS